MSGGQRQQTPSFGGLRRRGESFCPPDKGGLRGVSFPIGKQGGSPKSNPLPPSGGSPLSGGQRQQTPSFGGLRRRGESFCPPDKGGLRGVFFPIGKQGGSPKKNPLPPSGDPPCQGDNGSTSLIRGGLREAGRPPKNKPPPPFGGIPLIRGTTATNSILRGAPPKGGRAFAPLIRGD